MGDGGGRGAKSPIAKMFVGCMGLCDVCDEDKKDNSVDNEAVKKEENSAL